MVRQTTKPNVNDTEPVSDSDSADEVYSEETLALEYTSLSESADLKPSKNQEWLNVLAIPLGSHRGRLSFRTEQT